MSMATFDRYRQFPQSRGRPESGRKTFGSFRPRRPLCITFQPTKVSYVVNGLGDICFGQRHFFCSAVDAPQSAILRGVDRVSSVAVNFLVRNLDKVSVTVVAVSTAAAAPTAVPLFVWSLLAFSGRSVFFAIDGATAGGKVGPYVAL